MQQRDMSSEGGGDPVKQLVWALGMDPRAGEYFIRLNKAPGTIYTSVYAGTKVRMKKLTISGGVFSDVLDNRTITLSEASAASGELLVTTLFQATGEILRGTARINVAAWQAKHAFGLETTEPATPKPISDPDAVRQEILLYKKRVAPVLERF
jgi:hypothetical protein